MTTVDLPLEALALDYASFGIVAVVSNLWTWIAVVTAAVSFWGIRATTGGDSSPPVKLHHSSSVFEEIGTESERETAQTEDCEPQSTAETVTVSETAFLRPLIFNDGVVKGKLTVYYDGDGEMENDDEELTATCDGGDGFFKGKLSMYYDGEGELPAVSEGKAGEWWERWEGVVRTMNGEEGWYRYVDLTVFNGNVVRLWDNNGVRYGGRFSNCRHVDW